MAEQNDPGLALAVPDAGVAKYTTDEDFDALAKATDFLPRFQLYGSNSEACKEEKITQGSYGYVEGSRIIDCGKEVRAYALGYRLKAMRIMGDKVEVYFDPNHSEFKKIKSESAEKDTGSLCGPEFLLYIPAKKVFVTFFMANKTMRREAPAVRDYCPRAKGKNGPDDPGQGAQPFTLRSQLIKKAGYTWHGPVVSGCSVPLEVPDPDKLLAEMTKFNNPPESKEEAATEEEKAATSGRAR